MKRNLKLNRHLPHPPARVWKALTESKLLSQWLMDNDFRLEEGRRFQFETKPALGFDGVVHCKLLDFDEERYLEFSWKGGPIDSVVRFDLEPEDGGTRLSLRHEGFSGLRAVAISVVLGFGWSSMLRKKLPAVLDTLDDSPRPPAYQDPPQP